jgi:hypothetical protein
MWAIYILLMVWARRKDNADVFKVSHTLYFSSQ